MIPQDTPPQSDDGGQDPGEATRDSTQPKNLWDILNAPEQAQQRQQKPEQIDPLISTKEAPADSDEEVVQPRELHPEDYIPQDSSPAAPVSDDASQIQQILTDPDSVDVATEPRPEIAADDDFDSAIRAFHREAGLAVNCRNHPDIQAVDRCPECETYYCQDCMVIRRGKLLCRDCAESLYAPTEEEVLSAYEKGLEEPESEVAPEDKPEFQVGSTMFGLEGYPSHPLKRLLGFLIDLVITRALLVIVLFLLSFFLSGSTNEVFHIFDTVAGESTIKRVFETLVLLKAPIPLLIVMAVIDYLYYFLSLSFINRTWGMSWVSCRIVSEWGDYVSFGAVGLRTLVFMVCLGIPAILLALFFPAYRGPHDYAAGTVVINYSGVKRVDAYETVQIKL